MIKNNNVSHDTQGERIERLTLLAANIDGVAVEIGVSGSKLASAQTSDTDYLAAISLAEMEDGQMDEAFEEYHEIIVELTELYSMSKAHLLNIIWETEKPDDFMNAYGFNGRSPYRYDGLLSKITTWKDNHDRLVAEGDPRVLADVAMNNLVEKRDEMRDMRLLAYTEKEESKQAYIALHELFDFHTKLLQFIYTAAVLAWGNEDPRLELLGFLPASAVWTEGGGASPGIGVPENLTAVFGDEDVRITWDAVEGADGYYLSHTQFPPLFLRLYEGEATEFLHEMPDNGTHYYRVRAKVGDESGEYCDAVSVDVVVEAPPAPTKLKISLGGDNRTKVTWDSPSGVVYNGCSLYSVDVPTGSPVPARPSDPIWDELIVYSITMGELAPGMTRYVWVTGTLRGAESEATGPESVSL